MTKILEVKNLTTQFSLEEKTINAIQNVSFDVFKGKTLGIVGESGSGKSVTALSLMQLIPNPPGKISSGEVLFCGEDLLKKSEKEMRSIRGNRISMIFQEPMTSLNPVYTVGNQIKEVLFLHEKLSQKEATERAVHLLSLVGIPAPERRIREYPHQLSGGMRQRVMIAMALACNPEILIADEPTTALDVTIQAQILELMQKLQEEMGMGIILITHDLGVVAEVCHEVSVMYCGKIVESASVSELFSNPTHPYTQGLLESIPSLAPSKEQEKTQRLKTIPGIVPSLLNLPAGCSFQDRCAHAQDDCRKRGHIPTLAAVEQSHNEEHLVACFHPLNPSMETKNHERHTH